MVVEKVTLLSWTNEELILLHLKTLADKSVSVTLLRIYLLFIVSISNKLHSQLSLLMAL